MPGYPTNMQQHAAPHSAGNRYWPRKLTGDVAGDRDRVFGVYDTVSGDFVAGERHAWDGACAAADRLNRAYQRAMS